MGKTMKLETRGAASGRKWKNQNRSAVRTAQAAIVFVGWLAMQPVSAANLYTNNFGTSTISGDSYIGTFSTDFTSIISSAIWSTSHTGGFTSFTGSSGQALAISDSSGTPTITLTVTLVDNYRLTLDSTSFWRQRSSSGAQSYTLSVNGTQVNNGTVPTTGVTTGNLTPSTTSFGGANGTNSYTFTIGVSGASGSGTFRIDDFSLSGAFGISGQYWDPNGTTGVGGTGTWDTSANWNTSSDGLGSLVPFDASKTARFAGTAGSVTIPAGGVAANAGLSFDTTNYTISGGQLTLGGAAAAANTIAVPIGTATINADILANTGLTTTGLTKSGVGTLVLGGNVIGDVIVNDGAIQVIGTVTGNGTVAADKVLQIGMGGTTGSWLGDITNNGSVVFNKTGSTSYDGSISGTGSLTKNGSGSVTLTKTSMFTGGTTISAGALVLGHATDTLADTGAVTINNGTLDLGTNSDTVGAVSMAAGSITGSGTLTGSSFDLQSGTVTASLGGTGATVLKSGTSASVVTLSGASSYGGLTTISFGTLKLGAAGTSTNSPLGTIASGTSVNSGATLDLNGITLNTAEPLTLNGTGVSSVGALTNSSSSLAEYRGLVTLGSNATISGGGAIVLSNTGTITGAGRSLTLAGTATGNSIASVIGTGSGSLTKSDSGTWTLGGQNTYTGGTTIPGGTLVLGHATNTLADTGAVNITGGTLSLGSNSDTVGTVLLTTSGSITGTGVLSGTSYDVQSGTVSASLGGAGALSKTTTSVVTLSGSNTYTGGTTVSAGTLNLSHPTNTLADTGAVSISGGTIALGANSDTVGAVTMTGGTISGTGVLTGSSYDVRVGTISVSLGGVGSALAKSGSNTVTLNNASTYTGGTTISAGTLTLGNSNILADSGSLTINGGTFALGTNSDSVGAITLSSGTISGTGTLTGTSYTLESGTVSAALGGNVVVAKSTSSIVTLSGANTFSGETRVLAGTLKVGAAGTSTNSPLGTVAAGTIVSSGASLDLAGFTIGTAEPLTLSGTGVPSAGALTNSSTTAATYSGLVTLNGSTTIGNGTGNIILSNTGTITGAGSSLTLRGIGTANSIASIIGTGNASVTKSDSGSWSLTGSNTFTGGTFVTAGTLTLGNATNTLADTSVVTVSGGTLNLGTSSDTVGSVQLTAGSITGSTGVLTASAFDMQSGTASAILGGATSTLTKTTTGSVTLSGANTFAGQITLTEGAIRLGASSTGSATSITSGPLGRGTLSLGGGTLSSSNGTAQAVFNPVIFVGDAQLGDSSAAGKLTFSGSGTLTGTRQITVATDVDYSGVIGDAGNAFGIIKLGSGTLTFKGLSPNTYTGTTTVNAGSLVLNKDVSNAGNVIAGNLSIGSNGNVTLSGRSDQIADTATVTVAGTFGLSGNNETIAGLVVNGGAFSTGGGNLTTGAGGLSFTGGSAVVGINSASRSIILGGNVSVLPASTAVTIANTTGTTAANASKVDLNGATRTFDIASGSGAALNSELTIGTNIVGTSGGIVKEGAGTMILSGANSYGGDTTINAGKVVASSSRVLSGSTLSSSATGTGKVSINGGVLTGTGGIGAVDVNSGGMISAGSGATRVTQNGSSAGDTVGTLSTGDQSWKGGGTGLFKFANASTTAGTSFDSLTMSLLNLGSLGANNKFAIILTKSKSSTFTTPALNTAYKLVTTTGGITNGTTPFSPGTVLYGNPYGLGDLFTLNTSDLGIDSSYFTLSASSAGDGLMLTYAGQSPAPEPTTAAMFGLGSMLFLGRRRRRESGRGVSRRIGRSLFMAKAEASLRN